MKNAKLKGENVSYEQYCQTIREFEKSEWQCKWEIQQGLIHKVTPEGQMLPFFGDTTVYTLPEPAQDHFANLQNDLRDNFYDILAAPLDPRTFHITVHDLSNSSCLKEIAFDMEQNQKKCAAILKELRLRSDLTIDIRSTSLYPSRKIALINNFLPATSADYYRLLEVYNMFEEVQLLDYWPHLHVTLNYLLPQAPALKQQQQLKEFCLNMSDTPIELNIDLGKTIYQHFSDMNNYLDII